ncbi:hypothetical protein DYB25_008166 [Aphanomyces astaci]|uniref:Transmembrane protein n=1 Tax=Aphanomyces astaci TaxID=112090 RepID=A0A397AMS3_APHAT|nr:hypothetical protein DYB25_008166 [Aphanomyces astaci]
MNSFATTIHVASRQDLTPVLPLYKKWLPSSHLTLISQWAKVAKVALGVFCTFLLVVDVSSNNWELIDYVGDAKHLLTPLLAIDSVDTMQDRFTFCDGGAPSDMSQIGQFHINISLAQIQARDSNTFILGTTKHLIQDRANDICGEIVQSYPIKDPTAKSVRLGTVDDDITFARGTALTHWLGNTQSLPQATDGMNETQLRALGYVPARHSTDLRLMTPLVLPPPGQVTAGSVSMYRFFMKAFCSGCVPGTELGLDTCVIEYLYNDTTNTLEITSSQAILGGSHELGFIFQRRGGPILALYVRFVMVLLVIAVYTTSQKTVQWVDLTQQTLPQRLLRLVAPPLYRQPCFVFDLSDICFNSDIFVVLYSLTVLADEEISMVYSRVLSHWYTNSGLDPWLQLRLMSMTVRWLWLNCFLLKAAKWMWNVASIVQYTGDSSVMGWLNFSSVTWLYLGVLVLFVRNEFIEFSNSVIMDLNHATQNLDAVSVSFLDSWYLRAMPGLAVMLVINVVAMLALDRAANRRWWRVFVKSSVGRQLMFNSTSIVAEVRGDVVEHLGYTGVTMKARALATFRWFLSTHLTCFGLAEHPKVMRGLGAFKPRRISADDGTSSAETIDDTSSGNSRRRVGSSTSQVTDDLVQPSPSEITMTQHLYILVQDRDGHVHVIDGDKREMQALNVEVKILRDANVLLG